MNKVIVQKTEDYLIVKIPLKSTAVGKAEVSFRAQKQINKAISDGLRDIDNRNVLGPFKNVREFKKAIASR